MKELKSKTTALELHTIICARCDVRIGTGERHIMKARKAYHQNCFSKLEMTKSKTGRN